MKKRIFALAIASALGTGCASVQTTTLASDAAAPLQGKSIARNVNESPTFMAVTPGKGAFGALGAIGMASAGNKLVQTHGIDDPSERLGQQLQNVLESSYGVRAASTSTISAKPGDVKAMRGSAPDAELVLDVQTVGWGFAYDGFDFSHYVVNAAMDVRLIDLVSGKVIASSRCTSPGTEKDQMPTHDELMANNAQLLKSRLADVADYCTQTVATDIFGIDSAASVAAAIED